MNDFPRAISVLKHSALGKYADNSYGKFWYDDAVDAFESEAVSALSLAPTDSIASKKHKEGIRPFIIKVLLFIGLSSEYYAIIARLIETLAVRPQVELNDVIAQAAAKMNISVKALMHKIDRCFNVYNLDMFERISYLTRTMPMTPKDALVDLSSYVRVCFYSEAPIL